ncbi:hypothetical protein JCM19235_3847 [Vibrio maritimus]|uniref:Uncharacterized protein n=1 Tax=Vibrio maritimus TaxID=990268 RepID=A0A090RZF0_9VIBR|nr:hypothetical protein JCM19235_3847 [Vibrio maritimus]
MLQPEIRRKFDLSVRLKHEHSVTSQNIYDVGELKKHL